MTSVTTPIETRALEWISRPLVDEIETILVQVMFVFAQELTARLPIHSQQHRCPVDNCSSGSLAQIVRSCSFVVSHRIRASFARLAVWDGRA